MINNKQTEFLINHAMRFTLILFSLNIFSTGLFNILFLTPICYNINSEHMHLQKDSILNALNIVIILPLKELYYIWKCNSVVFFSLKILIIYRQKRILNCPHDINILDIFLSISITNSLFLLRFHVIKLWTISCHLSFKLFSIHHYTPVSVNAIK